jgi:hypothetical protein
MSKHSYLVPRTGHPTTVKKAEAVMEMIGGAGYIPSQENTWKPTEGWYVSIERASKHGLLLGPYPTKAIAEQHIQLGRDLAHTLDPFSAFDAFGVTRVAVTPSRGPLPEGKLNKLAKNWRYPESAQ